MYRLVTVHATLLLAPYTGYNATWLLCSRGRSFSDRHILHHSCCERVERTIRLGKSAQTFTNFIAAITIERNKCALYRYSILESKYQVSGVIAFQTLDEIFLILFLLPRLSLANQTTNKRTNT